MKFGKTLVRNQFPEWSRQYVHYKALKQDLKGNLEGIAAGEITKDDAVADREVEKVNSFFLYKRAELERRLRILTEKSKRVLPLSALTRSNSLVQSEEADEQHVHPHSTTLNTVAATPISPSPSLTSKVVSAASIDPSLRIGPNGHSSMQNGPDPLTLLNTSPLPLTVQQPQPLLPPHHALQQQPLSAGVPPSPYFHDPEADQECLQAILQTKDILSRLTWFAEMNRRAVGKILKKFDKRMGTNIRDNYLLTRVNLMAFVTDGKLSALDSAIDVLSKEVSSLVIVEPTLSFQQQRRRHSPDLQKGDFLLAVEAIRTDNAVALQQFIDSKKDQYPQLLSMISSRAQEGQAGQFPKSLFKLACQQHAFKCITLLMTLSHATMFLNINDQSILHKLAMSGGHVPTKEQLALSDNSESDHNHAGNQSEPDDPTLITFILDQFTVLGTKEGVCPLKSTADIFGRRPLHYAAMMGSPNIARALLKDLKATGEFMDFGNLHWLDSDGFTPLIYAVTNGHADVLEVLLDEGNVTDVDATMNTYAVHASIPKILPGTPMSVANRPGASTTESYFHAAFTYTPLSIASRMGHVNTVRLLINRGAHLNNQDEDGETSLMIAAKNGHVECVKLLIAGPASAPGSGANLELFERYYGWTALHLAAIEGNSAVVQALIDANADPDAYDFSGWNAHEHAVFRAHRECADLLRPITLPLDERALPFPSSPLLQQQDGSLGSVPSALGLQPIFGVSRPPSPMLTRTGSSQQQQQAPPVGQRPASPPVNAMRANVKPAKVASHRAYGHKYLEGESLIVLTLGSNDVRSTVAPVEMFLHGDSATHNNGTTTSSNHSSSDSNGDNSAISNSNQDTSSFMTASSAYSLEISSENATSGERAIIDLPLKDSVYHDQITFYSKNPEETVLIFSIYPTFGSSTTKLVGRGTAVLSSLDNLRKDVNQMHPTVTSLQGMNMTIPIIGVETMSIIGKVAVEISVVRPFQHENLKVGSKHTYWKSLSTTVIGHRGLGMNRKISNLQVGENTLLSFVTAASLGAEYVEFDVQMTKDFVPVLYHDWTVTETGLDIPVSSITMAQFRKMFKPSAAAQTSSLSMAAKKARESSPRPPPGSPATIPEETTRISTSGPPSASVTGSGSSDITSSPTTIAADASAESERAHRSLWAKTGETSPASSRVGRSNSLGAIARMKGRSSSVEPVDPSAKIKGNGLGTIQAPFATLKDTFETVPAHIGFNIEVKYPMLDEAEQANIPLYSFEMNLFVDRILQEVYDHDQFHPNQDRNIIFSSFHPDICLLLNLKQPNYPVFFLTDAGTSKMADRRCNSIQEAVRFATSIDLLGIVAASPPIIEAPILIRGIKESGLLVFTYGAENNVVENAKLQKRHGVDAVIVDSVLAVRKGLQAAG